VNVSYISLRLILLFSYLVGSAFHSLSAQAPSIQWHKNFGGSLCDDATFITQTSDSGFVVAGSTTSTNCDVSNNHGSWDFWITKLDPVGNLLWQKSFGGSGDDQAYSIKQTKDGGFVAAGAAYSNDGDVSGVHGVDYSDEWVIKLDSNGNLQWQDALGGIKQDWALAVQQTSDAGFVIAGYTLSNNADVSGNHGGEDCWIVKLDSLGYGEWQKCLGGSANDRANSIEQTNDGGFIIAGQTASNDSDVLGNHGGEDYWILKLDASANIVWQKCLGGSANDVANSIELTNDGGYIVAGCSQSNDGDVSGHHGISNYCDYWIVKLDSNGNLQWQKSLGGSFNDEANSILETSNGNFVAAGFSFSNDGDVTGNLGPDDYWIAELDTLGNLSWEECLGGLGYDEAYSIIHTFDGGLAVAGWSRSYLTCYQDECEDFWIVKLTGDIATGVEFLQTSSISVSPNPVQNVLTIALTTLFDDLTIHIYDLSGRTINIPASNFKSQTSNSVQLNTESLPAGFYTLQIINNITGATETEKFVKE
jgi:hypothetical protein